MTPYEVIAKNKRDLENKIFYVIDEFKNETGAEIFNIEIKMVNVSTSIKEKYEIAKIDITIKL